VGSPYERTESPSGGNDPDGVDLQLGQSKNTERSTEAPPEDEPGGVFIFSDPVTDMDTDDSLVINALVPQFPDIPSENEQIEGIREKEEAIIAFPHIIITQDDIDRAIIDWNGDTESKARVYHHMKEHGRSRSTASYLKQEYGDRIDVFTITKDGAEPKSLPWAKVQQRIGQLIEAGIFVIPNGQRQETVQPETTEKVEQQPESQSAQLTLDGFSENGTNTDIVPITMAEYSHFLGRTAFFSADNKVHLGLSRNYHHSGIAGSAYYDNFDGSLLHLSDNMEIYRFITTSGFPYSQEKMLERQFTIEDYSEYERILASGIFDGLKRTQELLFDGKPFIPVSMLIEGMPDYNDGVNQYANTNISNQDGQSQQTQAADPPANFRITNDHLGEGGAKTKYGFNVAAIRTLKAIETEGRFATPEEQEILSRSVGWGGIPQTFDPDNKQWERDYSELKGLLSEEEYGLARASTLNAHYTSPVVIKAVYETIERLGFTEGNILEPACGVGNFFGLLPESMSKSKLYGVELDSITGRIAANLYPNADIKVFGFEKTDTPDAFFDVAIGNVPFGSYKVNDPRYNKHDFFIHDYFVAKALDQVRPGGIVAFVTSKGTLDKAKPDVRKYIAQRADLLGAVRLPNNAFLKNAGTEVTSDIIFLQKRDRLIDVQPEWVHLGQTEDGVPINRYFIENPNMLLGTMAFDDRMYGNNTETTCNPIEGADLAEQLRDALSNIDGQITIAALDDLADEMEARASIPADPNVRNFS
jgi:hypothetical protein